MADTRDPMEVLESEFDRAFGRANWGAKLWSAAHHGAGTLSILASAAAAYVAATNEKGLSAFEATQIAALSGVAATLTAISAFAGFSKKWRINRETRLALELLNLNWRVWDADKLRDRFSEIMRKHERGIIGAEPE